ncbi:PREDICTED: uncharacterized protein LOC103599469 [Galeopterus variegatus]|uniref:Uncharacterized protein LOC103599469 n=1 Tax=Galeopterus variegatus TaxID=482537 RepID=A0ABM0RMI9_GALVR|nr:PREDICTED: uncharacterized protein LOC103599469 [Galeopterus variegatus]
MVTVVLEVALVSAHVAVVASAVVACLYDSGGCLAALVVATIATVLVAAAASPVSAVSLVAVGLICGSSDGGSGCSHLPHIFGVPGCSDGHSQSINIRLANCMDTPHIENLISTTMSDVEYIRSHYNIEDFIYFSHHQREEHCRLHHFALNPIFQHYTKFFLKEVLRLGYKSCLYYPIYPKSREDKFQNSYTYSLTSALHYLVPVRPRRQIVCPLEKLGINAPSEAVSKDLSQGNKYHEVQECRRVHQLPATELWKACSPAGLLGGPELLEQEQSQGNKYHEVQECRRVHQLPATELWKACSPAGLLGGPELLEQELAFTAK